MKAPLDRITCPACSGRGGEADMYGEFDDCPLCDGAGQVTRQRAAEWLDEDAATARALAEWTSAPAGDAAPDPASPDDRQRKSGDKH